MARLELFPDCSTKFLKDQAKLALKRYHPDKNMLRPEWEEYYNSKFVQVKQDYEIAKSFRDKYP